MTQRRAIASFLSSAMTIVSASSFGAQTKSASVGFFRSGSEKTPVSSSTEERSSSTSKKPTLADCTHGSCEHGSQKTLRQIFSGLRSGSQSTGGVGDPQNELEDTTCGADPSFPHCRLCQSRSRLHDRNHPPLKLHRRLIEKRQRKPAEHRPAAE